LRFNDLLARASVLAPVSPPDSSFFLRFNSVAGAFSWIIVDGQRDRTSGTKLKAFPDG